MSGKLRREIDHGILDGSTLADTVFSKLMEERTPKDPSVIENVSCYKEMFYDC